MGSEMCIRDSIAGDQEGTIVEGSGNEEGINPLWWPGDGPAPQVTSISLYKYGWLTNGNFGVTIKVYGYGSDTTTFDGRSISWIHQEPFIISGTGADGFYYTYDCLSLIHISEPTRLRRISYAVFCLKKKKKETNRQQMG